MERTVYGKFQEVDFQATWYNWEDVKEKKRERRASISNECSPI